MEVFLSSRNFTIFFLILVEVLFLLWIYLVLKTASKLEGKQSKFLRISIILIIPCMLIFGYALIGCLMGKF